MDPAGFRMAGMVAAICVALAGCEGGSAEEETPSESTPPPSAVSEAPAVPPGVDAEAVAQGRELFLPCAVCHGLDGRGNALGPSLRDEEWIHITGSLAEIEQVIREGVASPEEYPVPMVPMGGGDFDPEELRAVASYVYAISHPVSAAP